MKIQINRNFAPLGPSARWQAIAFSPIAEISSKIDFPEIKKTIQVTLKSSKRNQLDFYHESISPEESSIFIRSPEYPPLSEYFAQSENKPAFLQVAFLHEIGHAIFDPIFRRAAHNQPAKLRTIHSDLSGSSLADEIPAIKNDEHRNFLVSYLGQRLEERFCDSFAVLASAKLGVPISSSEELASNRSKEAELFLYDTSSTLSKILQDIGSGSIRPSSLDLMRCADLAKSFALEVFRQDLSHPCLSYPKLIEALIEAHPHLSVGGLRFFQERLDSRRSTAHPLRQDSDSIFTDPSESRSSRLG